MCRIYTCSRLCAAVNTFARGRFSVLRLVGVGHRSLARSPEAEVATDSRAQRLLARPAVACMIGEERRAPPQPKRL